uniref:Uncharacterized protein AlNc14C40G3419 n=1 Tax=Albugo laibachii Nc14 TaxID=890382 RepID=F0W9G0_9STRA|nr:conserved hypothetical protein [Albugo laibachii Nc14]|eukprot:CCA17774.1 conserved hypothetical protein [Albugo laibachii Nc14]
MGLASSPFVSIKVRHSLTLSPCHLSDPLQGIQQELNGSVMQYNETLKGVILCFNSIHLGDPYGHIISDSPYVHCKIIANALVFQPRQGMLLKAQINKIGSNHIGMLFVGVFNGSVAASELPEGFVYNYHKEAWIGKNGDTIKVDDVVTVKIQRVRVAGGMISIEGSMKFEEIKGNSGKQSKSASVKKRRKDIVQNEVEGEKTRATKKKKSKHTKQSKS